MKALNIFLRLFDRCTHMGVDGYFVVLVQLVHSGYGHHHHNRSCWTRFWLECTTVEIEHVAFAFQELSTLIDTTRTYVVDTICNHVVRR